MAMMASAREAERRPTRREKRLNAWQRRLGGIESALERWSGKRRPQCVVCKSQNVRIDATGIALITLRVPKRLHRYLPELRRRDNGRCLSCGLVQAFYRLSEPIPTASRWAPGSSTSSSASTRWHTPSIRCTSSGC